MAALPALARILLLVQLCALAMAAVSQPATPAHSDVASMHGMVERVRQLAADLRGRPDADAKRSQLLALLRKVRAAAAMIRADDNASESASRMRSVHQCVWC